MIPELGHLCLFLAWATAWVQAVVPLVGAQRGDAAWMALARPLALAQALLLGTAFTCLALAFAGNDFSVQIVVANSNARLPLAYRLAAIWGGHEGSLLLWTVMLGGWGLAVARASRGLPADFAARVLAVMGWLAAGLLSFLLFSSNPFVRLHPAAAEGRDLNPLLQDPAMILHPPLLYMGYVGFSVAFAFAIAALIGGRFDAAWARWTRPWTLAAWVCLSGGIGLGSWWAYSELGWGGWWFWDPVENASLMPWLAGTALVHSLAVSDQRNGFKAWTLGLSILCFALSLLGTFLVRSGVLLSVHAFATDSRRGLLILAWLVAVIGVSLALYLWRAPRIGLGTRFAALSRESLLLAGNLLLTVACAVVLLGTLYPLFIEALGLGKLSVGAPYFERVLGLLALPLLALLGFGPLVGWGHEAWRGLGRRALWPALLAAAVALPVALLTDGLNANAAAALVLAAWVAAVLLLTAGRQFHQGRAPAGLPGQRRAPVPRRMVAMLLAHLGVAAFVFGAVMVRTLQTERSVELGIGEQAELGGFEFRLADIDENVIGPNYVAVRARFEVLHGADTTATLHAEKRIYEPRRSVMTEAAIDHGLQRDLYVALGEQLAGGRWTVRLQIKPFVGWLWAGWLLMMGGGAVAASGRRQPTPQPDRPLASPNRTPLADR